MTDDPTARRTTRYARYVGYDACPTCDAPADEPCVDRRYVARYRPTDDATRRVTTPFVKFVPHPRRPRRPREVS